MRKIVMRFSGERRRGFSLVELVIVIVIIGIIAAIAIPRVSRGTRGAGESALVGDLAVLRNAVELYASEHNGAYPGSTADGTGNGADTEGSLISQLTKFSDVSGDVQDAWAADHPFGPYVRKGIPPLPVSTKRGNTGVQIDTTNTPPAVVATAGIGWVYNPDTGDLVANSDETGEDGTTTFNSY
jgi:prepilin-type N-terminal cleavage/methylation domain-containing protein